MFKVAILLSLLTAYVKAVPECWANYSTSGFFPCCPDGVEPLYTDAEGDWGLYQDQWCGIVRHLNINTTTTTTKTSPTGSVREELLTDKCWSMANGFPCCDPDNTVIQYIDQDGNWGFDEYGNWCGMWHSLQQWNDRERVDSTRKEWEEFKLKWDDYKNDFERLSIFPGEDETKLNFGWYSTTETTPYIMYSTDESMTNPTIKDGTVEEHYILNGVQYYSNKVSIEGLKPNTVYYYKRKLNDVWDKKATVFETRDPFNFNFVFVGDPQIGGSHDRYTITNNYERVLTVDEGTRNDAFNWNRTVVNSFAFAKGPSVLLSAGDQADEECRHLGDGEKGEQELYNEETQYSSFLLPKLMQTVPVAATVGNHDAANSNFRHHFNSPHPYLEPEYQGLIPGYNYFFRHYNVLVVVLETNYGTCVDFTKVINNAVTAYPDTDWRIAMFHHDIYGNGVTHSKEPYLVDELRPCLTGLFTDNNFDLVINGHDHVYTASKFVTKNGDGYKTKDIETGKTYTSPKSTLYITANCSTGSKLYTYYTGEDEPDYVYKNGQTFSPTFGILDFKMENGMAKLAINSYEVETYNVTDGPYYLEKPAKCWSKRLGYDCCKSSNTPVFETDKDGKWGLENDTWCGIVSEPKSQDTTTTTTRTTTTRTTTRTTTTTTTRTTTRTTTTTTTTTQTPQQTNCAAQYEQCGGLNYNGTTCCQSGFTCKFISDYYYQCL